MRTRRLGDSDLDFTTIGLGSWAMGGPWEFGWGPADDDESIAAVLHALEKGINWIDSAPIYGLGHAEEIIGKALRQTSQKPLIATKCSLLWNKNREKVNCLKAQSIENECHASLKRLGVEVIDLYQIHWPAPDEDVEEAYGQMAKLIDQGKVRYLGVSNFSIEQIERVRKIHPLTAIQPGYSMLHREIESVMLEYCKENNIGIVAYSPMQSGLLTGKFNRERFDSLPDDDHRRTKPDFQQPRFDATIELVEKLKPIAKSNDLTLAQLAIVWVLRKEEVTSAIVGARNPQQTEETSHASDIELDGDDIEKIEILLTQWQEKINGK